MAKIPFSFGGGGGDSSDDCTATAADVLESKTAIYNGSEDDAAAGTMKDYSGTTTQATGSMNSSNSRVQMAVPNTGKYDTAANLYVPYSTMRTLIGYTDASKVLTGTTICGLAGTMADKSGSSTSVTPTLASSQVRMTIPSNGYYNTSAYLYTAYSNMASVIGLTAAKMKYGETVLGITGTAQGYTATSTDLYYCGNHNLCGGTSNTYWTSGSMNWCRYCVNSVVFILGRTSSSGSTYYAGMSFPSTLNCSSYSSLTLTYDVIGNYDGSSSSCYIGIGLYSSRPTSASDFDISNATNYTTSTSGLTSTGANKTLTLNLSSITASRYVGVFIQLPSGSIQSVAISISRIAVS